MARNSCETTWPKVWSTARSSLAASESSFGHCEKSLALTRPLPEEWAGSLEMHEGDAQAVASQASWTVLAQVARGLGCRWSRWRGRSGRRW